MKKWWILLVMAVLLTGCSAQETFETVSDIYAEPASVSVQQIILELPEEAAAPALQNDDAGKLYLCDGYVLTVQTLDAGDLDKTLRQVTGFSRDALTLLQTHQGSLTRYACVWSAAGETGDQVGRAVVLDDGNFHYVVTVMADAGRAGELSAAWQNILGSFTVTDTAA